MNMQDAQARIESIDEDKTAALIKGRRFNAELAELDWGASLRGSAITQLAYFWGALDPESMLSAIEQVEDEADAETEAIINNS